MGDTQPYVTVAILGELEIRLNDQTLPVGHARRRAVLVVLAAEIGRVVPVDSLIDRIWGAQAPVRARSALRTYLSHLRRALAPTGILIIRQGSGYVLAAHADAVDLHRFRRLHALAREQRDASRALAMVEAALALWRGEPLPELDTPWAQTLRERLRQEHAAAAVDRIDWALECGRYQEVMPELTARVNTDTLDERVAGQLMLALYRTGRQADALRHYQRIRQRLVEELGTDPGPVLRQLHQRILNTDPTLGGRDAGEVITVPLASDESESTDVPAEVVAWRQLPRDSAEFTGRSQELAELEALVGAEEPEPPTAVVVSAIEGMAGIGKTRLAVHLAHRLVNRGYFDEVQLWTDLRGFDADHPPADPAEVLEYFLRLLGVPGERIPTGLESRAALYRDRLADKRALVLLDNAAREEQVRPLLPGRPGSLALVTSRRSFAGLDAHNMRLDVLPPDDAVQLMARIATDGRIARQRQAAVRVANLCGHLPIALSLAARRLRARPQWTVDNLADRLAVDERELRGVSPQIHGLNSTFDLSYRAVPAAQRRMFRLLGLHFGNDITAEPAAALAGWTRRHAEELLEALLDEHLLQQEVADRYRFHDLIRPYARHLADTEETADDRRHAVQRLLTWYLHAAEAARGVFDPHRVRIIDLPPLPPECTVPEFGDHKQALAWYEAERANLIAAVRAASQHGLPAVSWQLAWVMMSFFYRRSYWDDWITTFEIALTATRTTGERRAEGIIWRGLGVAHSDLRQFDIASDCYERAQTLFEEVGDLHAQGWNLNNLGVNYVDLDNLTAAQNCFQRALSLLRQTGDQQGEGFCLNNLGDTSRRLGDTRAAVAYLTEAQESQQRREDYVGLQFTLTTLGDVHHDTQQYDTALRYYELSIATSRRLDDQRTTARALTNLAKTHHEMGNISAAKEYWRQAHTIFTQLGDPQAEDIAMHLDEPPGPDSG